MSRFFSFLVVLTIAAFFMPPALAAETGVVIGQPCDTLGASTMTTDQKNIAVCLKNDSGALVWKSSTESAGTGTLCGYITYSISNYQDGPSWASSTKLGSQAPCNGQDLIASSQIGYLGNISASSIHCPPEYTLRDATTSSYSGRDTSSDSDYNGSTHMAFCMKD